MKTTQKVKAEAKASTDIEELKKLYEETKKSGGSLELEALRKTGQRESSVTKSSSLDVAELKKQYEVNKEKNIPRYLNPNLKPLKPRKPGKTYAEKKLARTARWKVKIIRCLITLRSSLTHIYLTQLLGMHRQGSRII